MTATRCRICEADLWHCHGTFVRHDDGSSECTEPDCLGEVSVHAFVVDCTDVLSSCCVPAQDLRAALG
jgi:hypothetical protein